MKMMALHWNNRDICLICVVVIIIVVSMCPVINTQAEQQFYASSAKWSKLSQSPSLLQRSKRSPFIVAFQVTRPPGMFQLSMKKPVIMGVMSNMTSMLLGSELARMFSRGITSSGFFVPSNVTTLSTNSTR